jgi:beta-carotene hydroxylase
MATTSTVQDPPRLHRADEPPALPRLSELGLDLLTISPLRRVITLATPFLCVLLFFVFAALEFWPLAVLSLVYLSFCTYGSISHDLVHRTLRLSRRMNDLFLSTIELLTLRSGHAYRMVHLHHHRRFPHDDDIEGAAARMTFFEALLDGVTIQFRMYRWALSLATADRRRIKLEGIGCVVIVAVSIALVPLTIAPLVYVILMIMGSWIIPVVTSYIPHCPYAEHAVYQTRLFRGTVASVIALEHLYHLEHHLYPAVPHHNWPRLAKRLDPYFESIGLEPVKIWF